MKKILFILALAGFVFTSCGNKKQQEEVGTHTHEDGTVYSNDAHDHESTAMPEQESFEVEADSIHENEAETPHDHIHEGEHNHQH